MLSIVIKEEEISNSAHELFSVLKWDEGIYQGYSVLLQSAIEG